MFLYCYFLFILIIIKNLIFIILTYKKDEVKAFFCLFDKDCRKSRMFDASITAQLWKEK